MCVEWVNDWETAAEDITAYKVCRKVSGVMGPKYESPTKPNTRADQGYGAGGGRVLEYKKGKEMTSAEPGFYCLAHPMLLAEKNMVLLEVIIPKGTRFRRGKASVEDETEQELEMRTLNPLTMKVKKEFAGEINGKFMWPVARGTNKYNWSVYVTCTNTTTATFYVNYATGTSTVVTGSFVG